MKNKYLVLIMVLMIGLLFGGCGEPEDAGEEAVETEEEAVEADWPSQDEVTSAIDEVIEDYYDDVYSDDEVIEALREVIPKPEGYPARSIEYIVPWGEGGGSDNYARHIGRDATKIMDEDIVFNNMPGGGGEVGLAYLLTQPADGYTIYGAIANQTINDALGTQPHSFTNDVDFIIRNQGATEIYWARADSEFETIQDALDYAVENPGQLTICGAGAGGDDEFRIASLSKELGTDIVYVPYDGTGERVSSLLGGHVDLMHETVGVVIDLYEVGDIKPLAYGGEIVFEELDPDVPCIADLGYDVPVGRWRGMVTVKGVDREIIDYLHNCFYASSKLPYYSNYEKEFFQHLPQAYLNSDDFKAYAIDEVERLKVLAKDLGYVE
ncbi:MAG: tripartite tricarboxylate transporter substrate binding protein [Bacillota bacterium]